MNEPIFELEPLAIDALQRALKGNVTANAFAAACYILDACQAIREEAAYVVRSEQDASSPANDPMVVQPAITYDPHLDTHSAVTSTPATHT